MVPGMLCGIRGMGLECGGFDARALVCVTTAKAVAMTACDPLSVVTRPLMPPQKASVPAHPPRETIRTDIDSSEKDRLGCRVG